MGHFVEEVSHLNFPEIPPEQTFNTSPNPNLIPKTIPDLIPNPNTNPTPNPNSLPAFELLTAKNKRQKDVNSPTTRPFIAYVLIQSSFTWAHSKGLGKIMPYSETALLPIWK